MLALDARWAELPYWQAIAKNASRWTPDYLLMSLDLRRGIDGSIEQVAPDQRVFTRILLRTFEISAVVTLACLLLGYPLAYWLSTLPARKANVLMILVLVPFWTSILVRVAAWIVLLQREGLVNKALPLDGATTPEAVKARLLELDARWSEPVYWQAIAKNGSRWTPDYLLAAVDLRRDAHGSIERMPEEQRAFGRILLRTFEISALVTVWALLAAYPLAYWLATLPPRRANLLMILVLVPFWTSVLVRVAAWIVLLQNEGLVNGAITGLGLWSEPLPLLFNRTGVVIAMVHILLPFMILPLYSVMKSVPPTYLRAAVSLGSSPLAAFFRVYVPQTYPGIGAGALLVFILAIGYYVTPALLGGADDQMLSYYVAHYTNVDINWGMACALGALLLTATLLLYGVYRQVVRSELSLG
jgi:putative spermidine/putrescine transport system permease protein